MQQAEWLDNTTALYKWLEYFKSQGKTIEGIDIDSQLRKYQTQIEEQKAQEEDKWFFEAIGDVIKRRGDKGAEILIAGVKREWGQGKLESWIQYGANIIAGLADVAGTAVMEWLDAITPEAVQEKLKEWLQKAFETKWGEFVMWKLQEVNDNMETLRELNPRVARNFEAFWDTVNSFLTFYGWSQAKKWADALVWKVDDVVWGVDTLASRTATNIKQWIDDVWEAITTVGGKIWDATKQTAKGTFWQVYKLNQDTIEQAFKNPKLFTEAQKMGAKDYIKETTDKVISWIEQRIKDLSVTGKEYNQIRKAPWTFQVYLKPINDTLTEKGIKIWKNWELSFKWTSLELDTSSQATIQKAYDFLRTKTNLNAERLLNTRQSIDTIIDYRSEAWDLAKSIVRQMRWEVDNQAKRKIPWLKELDTRFAPEIKELEEIKRIIYTDKGKLKQNYIWEIANALWDSKIIKLENLKKVVPDIEDKINMYKALKDIDNAVQGFKVWTYQSAAGTAISWGIWALAGWPAGAIVWAVVYQMITNPKLGIEIIKKLAIANDIKNAILKKVKDWIKLKADEARALVQWVRSEINEQALKGKEALWGLVDDVADKVGARAKFMDDTGRSLDDFDALDFVDKKPKDFLKLWENNLDKLYKKTFDYRSELIDLQNRYNNWYSPLRVREDIKNIRLKYGSKDIYPNKDLDIDEIFKEDFKTISKLNDRIETAKKELLKIKQANKSLDDFKGVGTTWSAKIRTVSDSVDLEKIKWNDRIISMLKWEWFDWVKNSRWEFIFPKEIKATIIEDIPKMDKSNMTPLQKRFDKYWGGYVENMEIWKVDDIYKNGKEMGLDNQEMAALWAYIRNEYFPLNQALRKWIKSDTKMNTLKKMIDEWLSKLPDYKWIVYREWKLPKEIVSQLDTGKSFTDKAYMSTSMSDDIVKDFKLPSTTKDYSVHYEIKTKTWKDISKINPSEEKEILIKPNTEFKITEIKKVNEWSYWDRIYIKAEEI